MGLWKPGTEEGVTFHNAKLRLGIEGITRSQLAAILQKIRQDHTFNDTDSATYSANLNWDEMPINEWNTNIVGDSFFDDCCAAASVKHKFRFNGEFYIIRTAIGGMEIVNAITMENPLKIWKMEKEVAQAIRESGFVNPDPYIGLIEITYHSSGYRAGYGIRKSGKIACWYN